MKLLFILFIAVAGIIGLAYSPLSKDIKTTWDEHWHNKWQDKRDKQSRAEKETQNALFNENNHVRRFNDVGVAGSKVTANIKVKPTKQKACLVKVNLSAYDHYKGKGLMGLSFIVRDADGFERYTKQISENNITALVGNNGMANGGSFQFTAYEDYTFFDDCVIELGTYGNFGEHLEKCRQKQVVSSDIEHEKESEEVFELILEKAKARRENDLKNLAQSFLKAGSSDSNVNQSAMLADIVHYFGKRISRSEAISEIVNYRKKWSFRDYNPEESQVVIKEDNTAKVMTWFSFRCENAKQVSTGRFRNYIEAQHNGEEYVITLIKSDKKDFHEVKNK